MTSLPAVRHKAYICLTTSLVAIGHKKFLANGVRAHRFILSTRSLLSLYTRRCCSSSASPPLPSSTLAPALTAAALLHVGARAHSLAVEHASVVPRRLADCRARPPRRSLLTRWRLSTLRRPLPATSTPPWLTPAAYTRTRIRCLRRSCLRRRYVSILDLVLSASGYFMLN
jgi:hypothetical protein